MYSIQQYYIRLAVKHELFETIPTSALERIADSDQLDWEEEGKEFYYHGELYDVVTTTIENGITIWLCLEDEKETKLLKAMARAARARADHQGKGKKSSYPHFSTDFLLVVNDWQQSCAITSLQKTNYVAARLISSTSEVKGPPPKVCLM